MEWETKCGTKDASQHLERTAKKPLPPKDDPHGVPRAIMKALAQSGLSNDPQAYKLKLQQLLKEAEND